jgi:D-amino-acid dehydrogenase
MKTYDAIVLGAGIVGVSAALHLAMRGRSVLLVDRRGPGEETSHGNAGLIERSSVVPYAFPRNFWKLARYGLNRESDAAYHLAFMPRLAGWLLSYWRHSAPERLADASAAMLPLIERSVIEHDALTADAGTGPLLVRRGWIELFKSGRSFAKGSAEAADLKRFGLAFEVLDREALREREPALGDGLVGGVHWIDPVSVSDPGALTKAYAALFERRGGTIAIGDAGSLRQAGPRLWTVMTEAGEAAASDVVVALGAWSDTVFRPLGYRIPLAVKRGYHMHYEPAGGNAGLTRPVVDVAGGYVLAPMTRGIRLTTGVEFADRDAPPSPVQLGRAETMARALLPLGRRLDPEPWMGRRPALPDMRPVIGPAPRHPGLWFAFGHAHHGLTLGPVTGRLLAEMITGEPTVVDPAPYAMTRFAGA